MGEHPTSVVPWLAALDWAWGGLDFLSVPYVRRGISLCFRPLFSCDESGKGKRRRRERREEGGGERRGEERGGKMGRRGRNKVHKAIDYKGSVLEGRGGVANLSNGRGNEGATFLSCRFWSGVSGRLSVSRQSEGLSHSHWTRATGF